MHKIIATLISVIFLGVSLVAFAAVNDTSRSSTNDVGFQVNLAFDANWIAEMNRWMKDTPGSYLQWEEIQLRNANGQWVQTIYHRNYGVSQTTFPSQRIIIYPTTVASSDFPYKVMYMYQIYKLGRYGEMTIQAFPATFPYDTLDLIYPTHFQQ